MVCSPTPPSTSLARTNTVSHRRQHLEVLHQHLREVRLAEARLAEQRGDGGPPLAGGERGRRPAASATSVVPPHQRRHAHARGGLLGRFLGLAPCRTTPGRPGNRLGRHVGQHLDGGGGQQHAGRIGLRRVLLLLREQRALVTAAAVGPRLDRHRRQIDEGARGQAAGDHHLRGGGGGAGRVVADLVAEGEHELRAGGVRQLRRPPMFPASRIAPRCSCSRRTAGRRRAARGPAAAGFAAAAPRRRSRRRPPAAAGAAAVASRRARSAASPAVSARRSSVASAKRRLGSLARQRIDRVLERRRPSSRLRDSAGGRRLRWLCCTSAGLPQNGGAPVSIS